MFTFIGIIILFLFLWIAFLSFVIYKLRSHYIHLTSNTRKQRLNEILDSLVGNNEIFTREIDVIKKELVRSNEQVQLHIKKVGLVRFNPFERSSGEQSFVLSLLNGRNDGVVINFIYTKEGLRVYGKKIKEGKGDEYELSDEEKKAIERSS